MFTANELQAACTYVHKHIHPSPLHKWPLLDKTTGRNLWVKHENHLPTGAFKVRGGLTFVDWVRRTHPQSQYLVTATRGNHGQSQARAARAAGLGVKIYVPQGNSEEKNQAMEAFGGEVIIHGSDFDEAKAQAMAMAEKHGWIVVPPFHKELVRGVATYGFEILSQMPDLQRIYVPIGCGSGICGTIAARDALGLDTEIIGVVTENAAGAKLSYEQKKVVQTNAAQTFADGMAVRVPVADALDIYTQGASRIVAVSEDEIASAIRMMFSCTHNVAEGAGAAALAAAIKEKSDHKGEKTAVILSGGNIDSSKFQAILAGKTPRP